MYNAEGKNMLAPKNMRTIHYDNQFYYLTILGLIVYFVFKYKIHWTNW